MRKPDKTEPGRPPATRPDTPPADHGSDEENEIDRYIEQVSRLIPQPRRPKPDGGN